MAERAPGASSSISDRASVGEVVDAVTAYAKQETVEPLRRAGRYVGFGAAGGLLTGIGVSLLLLGLLRFVQTEWTRSAEGRLSWLAYVIAFGGLLVLGGASAWFANRQITASIMGEDSTR
ncbi:MAG: phage holin family protein [Ilumatobacteraceae bacterium]